jgi:uncharacterized protein YecE (DUF72 family)
VRTWIGTSGYSYPKWKGRFYPKKLPASQMLAFYAGHFNAVEINSTFYGLPEPQTAADWSSQAPKAFRFAFKAPGEITHRARLARAPGLERFLALAAETKSKGGPLLFQLPPNMKKDAGRLRAFAKLLPPRIKAAFEFRHSSWFDFEIFDLLRERGLALCIAESDDLATPLVSTAPWGYLRLRKSRYTATELMRWAKAILQEPWKEAHLFFKHEDEARGIRYADKLRGLL